MHIEEVLKAINTNHRYEYFVVNAEGKVVEFSDQIFAMCKMDKAECNKLKYTDIVEELVGLEQDIEEIFEGKRASLTIPYVFKYGKYFNIRVHPGKISKNKEGYRYQTVVILLEDITEIATTQQSLVQEKNEKSLLLDEISSKNAALKRYNEQMQEMVDREMQRILEKQKRIEAKARYAQMGEMLSMFTHQWKQPLNIISVIANVLKLNTGKQERLSDEQIVKKLERILDQVDHMNKTVTDFQQFFSPYKETVAFDVCEHIAMVVDLVAFLFEYHDIELNVACEKGNIRAIGYPNEFKQVMLTLLSNAKDAYLAHPSEEMEVRVSVCTEREQIRIVVADKAGGIDEAMLAHIFDLYVSNKKDGSGLGLTLAKTMIEEHMNGTLKAYNADGGAVFEVTLPLAP